MSRSYLLFGVVVVAAAGALAWSAIGRSSGPNPSVTFATVPAANIAYAGIILSAPQGASSAAAGQAAASAASSDFGGRAVRESHYAHCVDTQSVPALSEDCWAVSLDPSGLTSHGPAGSTPKQYTYLLVLIDPTNNKFIEAAEGP